MYLLCTLILLAGCNALETFSEEIVVSPVQDGDLMVHFQFTTSRTLTREEIKSGKIVNFNLFPKSIGQIIDLYKVSEMHLSFAQGRWEQEKWGHPLFAAPPGVELWAWFKSANGTEEQWKSLSNALGGLFSASLHFMYTKGHTVQPKRLFRPEGSLFTNENQVYHSILPREAVCVENLTPWLNLLPCRRSAGLGSLIAIPTRIYDVKYHSMKVDVYHENSAARDGYGNPSNSSVHLRQTLTLVIDNPTGEYTLDKIFGVEKIQGCPLATHSHVYIRQPSVEKAPKEKENGSSFSVATSFPENCTLFNFIGTDARMCGYDIHPVNIRKLVTPSSSQNSKIGLSFTIKTTKKPARGKVAALPDSLDKFTSLPPIRSSDRSLSLSPLSVNRFLTGYGKLKGGLAFHFFRTNSTQKKVPVKVTVLQSVPWYFPVYFHTFKMEVDGVSVKPEKEFDFMRFSPALPRVSPSVIEVSFKINSQTNHVMFEVEFAKSILHFFEYTPDPNRGFDVSPAIVFVEQLDCTQPDNNVNLSSDNNNNNNNNNSKLSDGHGASSSIIMSKSLYYACSVTYSSGAGECHSWYLYTNGLSVQTALPDFSMPYNVITLTCTVVAFFFGQIAKILVRRYGEVLQGRKFVSQRPVMKLLGVILRILEHGSKKEEEKKRKEDEVYNFFEEW